MKFTKLGVALIFIVAQALLPAHSLAAVQPINLQTSPLPIELSVDPGKSVSSDLRVRNAGSQTQRLQVRIVKVTEDDNGGVHLTKPKASDEFVNWISFSRTAFDAPSNQWQTITMTVSPPKDAAFGYYFAVEFVQADQQQRLPGEAVANGAVATFVLLNVGNANAKREANLVSFSASRRSYEFLPVNFRVKVHASGNVHVAPYGNIFIMRGSKQIGAIGVNAAQGNILPNSSRFFDASWKDGFPVYTPKFDASGRPVVKKDGSPAQRLKWDFGKAQKLRFGHYTAHLVMIYDNGQRDVPIEATVSFWVIPWRVIGGVIVVLALTAVGLWSSFRKISGFASRQTRKLKKNEKK